MGTELEAHVRRARLGVILDLGIYWGWMSLVFFSTTLAGPGGIAAVELANFVALAVSTAVVAVVAFLSPALAQRVTESRLLRVAVTLAASGGTLLVLWGANADASLIAGACLVGLPEGCASANRQKTSSCCSLGRCSSQLLCI